MNKHERGVTLIELLIAVVLLALLSVGMLMALRVGLSSMDRANDKLMANRKATRTQQILRSQIEGFMPVTAAAGSLNGQPAMRVPFFDGRPEAMRFVSSYSLDEAARGRPRILELAVIPAEDGKGVRLIVNEPVYEGPESAGALFMGMETDPETRMPVPRFAQIMAGPKSFVLADHLSFCRFSYRRKMQPPVLEQWYPQWRFSEWPTGVKIEMAPFEPDPGKVPLVTATVPIRVNRMPGWTYGN